MAAKGSYKALLANVLMLLAAWTKRWEAARDNSESQEVEDLLSAKHHILLNDAGSSGNKYVLFGPADENPMMLKRVLGTRTIGKMMNMGEYDFGKIEDAVYVPSGGRGPESLDFDLATRKWRAQDSMRTQLQHMATLVKILKNQGYTNLTVVVAATGGLRGKFKDLSPRDTQAQAALDEQFGMMLHDRILSSQSDIQVLQDMKNATRIKLLVLSETQEAELEFASVRVSLVKPGQQINGALTMGSSTAQYAYFNITNDQMDKAMAGTIKTGGARDLLKRIVPGMETATAEECNEIPLSILGDATQDTVSGAITLEQIYQKINLTASASRPQVPSTGGMVPQKLRGKLAGITNICYGAAYAGLPATGCLGYEPVSRWATHTKSTDSEAFTKWPSFKSAGFVKRHIDTVIEEITSSLKSGTPFPKAEVAPMSLLGLIEMLWLRAVLEFHVEENDTTLLFVSKFKDPRLSDGVTATKFEWTVGLAAKELGILSKIDQGEENPNAGHDLPKEADAWERPLLRPISPGQSKPNAQLGNSEARAVVKAHTNKQPDTSAAMYALIMDAGSRGDRYYLFENKAGTILQVFGPVEVCKMVGCRDKVDGVMGHIADAVLQESGAQNQVTMATKWRARSAMKKMIGNMNKILDALYRNPQPTFKSGQVRLAISATAGLREKFAVASLDHKHATDALNKQFLEVLKSDTDASYSLVQELATNAGFLELSVLSEADEARLELHAIEVSRKEIGIKVEINGMISMGGGSVQYAARPDNFGSIRAAGARALLKELIPGMRDASPDECNRVPLKLLAGADGSRLDNLWKGIQQRAIKSKPNATFKGNYVGFTNLCFGAAYAGLPAAGCKGYDPVSWWAKETEKKNKSAFETVPQFAKAAEVNTITGKVLDEIKDVLTGVASNNLKGDAVKSMLIIGLVEMLWLRAIVQTWVETAETNISFISEVNVNKQKVRFIWPRGLAAEMFTTR